MCFPLNPLAPVAGASAVANGSDSDGDSSVAGSVAGSSTVGGGARIAPDRSPAVTPSSRPSTPVRTVPVPEGGVLGSAPPRHPDSVGSVGSSVGGSGAGGAEGSGGVAGLEGMSREALLQLASKLTKRMQVGLQGQSCVL